MSISFSIVTENQPNFRQDTIFIIKESWEAVVVVCLDSFWALPKRKCSVTGAVMVPALLPVKNLMGLTRKRFGETADTLRRSGRVVKENFIGNTDNRREENNRI